MLYTLSVLRLSQPVSYLGYPHGHPWRGLLFLAEAPLAPRLPYRLGDEAALWLLFALDYLPHLPELVVLPRVGVPAQDIDDVEDIEPHVGVLEPFEGGAYPEHVDLFARSVLPVQYIGVNAVLDCLGVPVLAQAQGLQRYQVAVWAVVVLPAGSPELGEAVLAPPPVVLHVPDHHHGGFIRELVFDAELL